MGKYLGALLAVLVLLSSLAYADQYIGATVVGVQENPYSLEQVAVGAVAGSQGKVYEREAVASVSTAGEQGTVYEMESVVGAGLVGVYFAKVPEVKYTAVYNQDTNKTVVTVEVNSDPVQNYFVFIFDPDLKELYRYTASNAVSTAVLNGEYNDLFIMVITDNIGKAGLIDLGTYPAFVYGSNIIPVHVETNGEYEFHVYGGYAISPLRVYNTAYVIAKVHVVKIFTIPA